MKTEFAPQVLHQNAQAAPITQSPIYYYTEPGGNRTLLQETSQKPRQVLKKKCDQPPLTSQGSCPVRATRLSWMINTSICYFEIS